MDDALDSRCVINGTHRACFIGGLLELTTLCSAGFASSDSTELTQQLLLHLLQHAAAEWGQHSYYLQIGFNSDVGTLPRLVQLGGDRGGRVVSTARLLAPAINDRAVLVGSAQRNALCH